MKITDLIPLVFVGVGLYFLVFRNNKRVELKNTIVPVPVVQEIAVPVPYVEEKTSIDFLKGIYGDLYVPKIETIKYYSNTGYKSTTKYKQIPIYQSLFEDTSSNIYAGQNPKNVISKSSPVMMLGGGN
jgi:hypothetical protein